QNERAFAVAAIINPFGGKEQVKIVADMGDDIFIELVFDVGKVAGNPELADAFLDVVKKYGSNADYDEFVDILKKYGAYADDLAEGVGNLKFKTGKAGEEYLAKLVGGESQVYFKTSQGGRYIDQLADDIAYESKVGYTTLTDFVKKQILKDAELIEQGAIKGANWNFFRSDVTGKVGASKPLLDFLEQHGITYTIHN
ncbi:MAG: hypothetical protein AAGU76_11835, partial [Sedimentibacter sp.]